MSNLDSKIYASIIELIKINRISTTEVADCLGKTGAIEGVLPVNAGMHAVGKCRYIYGHSESNWSIHEQARDVCVDDIVVMDGINVANRALVGELVTKYIILYKRATAIVALGKMRDANDLIKQRYAVWCAGVSPIGCFNTNVEESDEIRKIAKQRQSYYDNAIAVCDDSGVVIIPENTINNDFYKALINIEKQEDIWFNCIDFRKWDTFETVCLKRYQTEDTITMKIDT